MNVETPPQEKGMHRKIMIITSGYNGDTNGKSDVKRNIERVVNNRN